MLPSILSTNPLQNFFPYLATFLIAFSFIVANFKLHKKAKIRTAFRILFAKKIWLSPSTILDYKYVFVGALIFANVVAYTTITGPQVSEFVYTQLSQIFGAHNSTKHSQIFFNVILATVLFLTYEFAYWLNHYLCHKIPFLWEFHKVHHSATTLTPLTNWRMHPVDTILYLNTVSVILGATCGIVYYVMGKEIAHAALSGTNIIMLSYMALYGHLQHSQLWIPTTGLTGRIFLSPAHHQIHHSTNPIHFNTNLGAGLAVFDWLFGTLHLPSKQKQKLVFGVQNDRHLTKFITSILHPFLYAWKHIRKIFGKTIQKYRAYLTAEKLSQSSGKASPLHANNAK